MKGLDKLKSIVKRSSIQSTQLNDTDIEAESKQPEHTRATSEPPLHTEEEGIPLHDEAIANDSKTFAESDPLPKKARRIPFTPLVILVAVVCIIIVAAVTATLIFGGEERKEETENEIFIEPTRWEDTETIEGDISGGGPMTFVPDERVPFEVNETVYQMDIVLSWDPQNQDLDLVIEDPSGSEAASSGNAPGEEESVRIKGRIEPGTWTAVIDPFAALNVHYTLEITFYHESGNDTSGELLYQKTMSLTGESGEEHDEFEVGAEYESLFIQVEMVSSEGSFSTSISDPDGEEVYSAEVSGEDTVPSQETADAKEGTGTVDYSYEAFTGTVVVQVMGS